MTGSLFANCFWGYNVFISRKKDAVNYKQPAPDAVAPPSPTDTNPPSNGEATPRSSTAEARQGDPTAEGFETDQAAERKCPEKGECELADFLSDEKKQAKKGETKVAAAQLRVYELLEAQEKELVELEQSNMALITQKTDYEREPNALRKQSEDDKQQMDERFEQLDEKEAELATLASELNPQKEVLSKEQTEVRAQLDEERRLLSKVADKLKNEAMRLETSFTGNLQQKEG